MNQPSALYCPGCKESVSGKQPRQTHISPITKERYLLFQCSYCDLWFWWPRELDPDLYRSEALHEYSGYHQGTRPFPPWTLPFFGMIPIRSGSLLDVGCGDGAFLARAASLGFVGQGIDLDEHSVQVAQEVRGLHATTATLATFVQSALEDGVRFNVVCIFEVLEHQADPGAFLEMINAVVAPGGYLAGSVPNRDRFLARIDRQIGTGDLPPHHFLWFSARALTQILERHGFLDIQVLPSGNVSLDALLRKVSCLGTSRLAPLTRRFPRISDIGLRILTAPIVILLWAGLKWRPAHIYFQARRKLIQA